MSHSYIFLAEGFEEIEALTVVDVMRRAGMVVNTVSITSEKEVIGAHGIPVICDCLFADTDFDDAEWLIAPGGMPGSTNLHEFAPLNDVIKAHKGKVAAICAAPAVVLAPLGILNGKEVTCYPGFESLCEQGGANMVEKRVAVQPSLVTANGPSAALKFALAIVGESLGQHKAQEVGSAMGTYPKAMDFYF